MAEQTATRVLIAENDYLVTEAICGALEEIGCEKVGEAADGLQAIHLTCSEKPDVVLMDIKMPEMDGIEATRRIQEQCPTPVVVLTAYETQDLIREASEAGVSAYLTKPPRTNEIERAITIARARFNEMAECRRLCEELNSRLKRTEDGDSQGNALEGFLPICSHCKKIREEDGHWCEVDAYVEERCQAQFTHGVCPDCLKEHYPDLPCGQDE